MDRARQTGFLLPSWGLYITRTKNISVLNTPTVDHQAVTGGSVRGVAPLRLVRCLLRKDDTNRPTGVLAGEIFWSGFAGLSSEDL